MMEPTIVKSEPRKTIRVTLHDNTVLEGLIHTTTETFLKVNEDNYDAPLVAAIVDGELRELSYPLTRDAYLEPILLSQSDGGRIYRRSLVLLLTTAADELWPGCQVSVRYAVPDGGFYCTRVGATPFTEDELAQLNAHMRRIVEEDAPIKKRMATLQEARNLFASRGENDKVRLLIQRNREDLILYQLHDREDYYYGYMLPSTGYMKNFRLLWFDEGFVLQYPRKESPESLLPIKTYDKLRMVFRQSDEWLQRMEVEDVGRLNLVMKQNNRLHELILVAEALHEQRIAAIARDISQKHIERGLRLVLIAGPSSSGKTTFSKRLAIQLLAHGLRPFTLEMDNYFVDRESTPRDEKGDYDFESIDAVNLPSFNQDLLNLIAGAEVQLPRFDFHVGKSVPGRKVRLKGNQIVIIEGIHGLNPNLVPDVPVDMVYRVYVSALTQLNVDDHNRVPTTDVRLLRRIVRDARTRGYTVTDTLKRWSSVRRGELRNIFPYQENADVMFNSALVYELAALRPFAEPLLLQVEPRTPSHIEAKRLLSFLRWVYPLAEADFSMIPDTSLLREFIGQSTLDDYHPINLDEDSI